MPALDTKQISLQLKTLPGWSTRAKSILRTYAFEGFPESIQFVQRVARKAKKANHHPDITIHYDQVTLTLTTHDQGGITKKDFELARQCEDIFSRYFT